jgi:hypothetical protein
MDLRGNALPPLGSQLANPSAKLQVVAGYKFVLPKYNIKNLSFIRWEVSR